MLVVLKQELYAHFKSILFARKKLFFLVILSEQNDIEVNKENIKAMTTPKSITEDRWPITYFIEKLSRLALNYRTYVKEVYALLQSLES